MLQSVLDRIDRRLVQMKLTDAGASRLAGKSVDLIRDMRRGLAGKNGNKMPKLDALLSLSPVLGVNFLWLATGQGPEEASSSDANITIVPVISWVAAGAGREAEIDSGEWPLLPMANLPQGDWFALNVRGDSMDHAVPDGGRILVNRRDKTLVNKKLYVAAIGQEGSFETTFKRYIAGPTPMLAPWSSNPDHVPIIMDQRTKIIGRVTLSLMEW